MSNLKTTIFQGDVYIEASSDPLVYGSGNLEIEGDIAVSGGISIGGSSAITGASNIGVAGVGVFNGLSGSTLQFKNINAGSNKISIVNDSGNAEIDIDVVQGNIPHSGLSGLAVGDDHTQYALLAGRTGGQILTGGSGVSNNLTLRSTSNATKGSILIDETTTSTSTTTGALRVGGGAGIVGNVFIGGTGNVAGVLNATSGTASSSISTGALVVTGGAGISGNLNIGGNLNVSGTFNASISHSTLTGLTVGDDHTQYMLLSGRVGGQTLTGGTASGNNLTLRSSTNATKGSVLIDESTPSTNTTTGALVVSGGLGVGGNIYSNGLFDTGNRAFSIAGTNLNSSSGTVSVVNNPSFSGITSITNTTNSTSSTSGALNVAGGISVSNSTDALSSSNGGALTLAGGAGIAKKLFVGDVISASNTIDMNNTKIINVATPTNPQDVANKAYVDNAVQGIDVKSSVVVATTTSGTLSTSFQNGSIVDGITLNTGDRILIKNQSSSIENGIYIVQASGSPVRASDFSSGSNVAGAFTFIEEGTVNAESGWICTNDSGSDVVGTNGLTFVQFSGAGQIIAGTGLTKTGNQLSVNSSQTQITEIGTITTGIWNGSIINVPFGGTGNSSFTANSVLLGNGSGAIISSAMTYTSSTLNILKINSSDSTSSTSSTTGSITLLGGIGIGNTTDATNVSNGGSLTSAGGASFAKSVFIGGVLSASSGTASTNTTTGALLVTGGAGVSGNIFIGGTGNVAGVLNATSGTASTNTTTGALVVTGGAGISGNLNVGGNLNVTGTFAASIAHSSLTGLTVGDDHTQYTLLAGRVGGQTLTGGTGISNNLVLRSTTNATKGSVLIDETTTSTSTTTGALRVGGGAGIVGNIFIGGTGNIAGVLNATSGTASTNTTTGALVVAGGAGISGNVFVGGTGNIAGVLNATSGTTSTNTTTGALVVTGGAGISGNLNVGGNLNVTGTFAASIAHSSLTGLTVGDDHTQYTLLAGRVGGQTLTGGTASGNNLVLRSTTNATKGSVLVDETTTSTSTTTGALRVGGGAGIVGNVFIGGSGNVAGVLNATSGTASSSTTTGAVVVTGGVGVSGSAFIGVNASVPTLTLPSTISITNPPSSNIRVYQDNADGRLKSINSTGTVQVYQPTTSLGDIPVNNGTTLERFPAGTDNQMLIANSVEPLGLQWIDRPVFGTNYFSTRNAGSQTNTTTTFATSLTLTTGSLEAGDYIYVISGVQINGNSNQEHEARSLLDGVQQNILSFYGQNVVEWPVYFSDIVTLTAGVHTVALQFRRVGSGTITSRNILIYLYRVA